jgi:hypothetical protein
MVPWITNSPREDMLQYVKNIPWLTAQDIIRLIRDRTHKRSLEWTVQYELVSEDTIHHEGTISFWGWILSIDLRQYQFGPVIEEVPPRLFRPSPLSEFIDALRAYLNNPHLNMGANAEEGVVGLCVKYWLDRLAGGPPNTPPTDPFFQKMDLILSSQIDPRAITAKLVGELRDHLFQVTLDTEEYHERIKKEAEEHEKLKVRRQYAEECFTHNKIRDWYMNRIALAIQHMLSQTRTLPNLYEMYRTVIPRSHKDEVWFIRKHLLYLRSSWLIDGPPLSEFNTRWSFYATQVDMEKITLGWRIWRALRTSRETADSRLANRLTAEFQKVGVYKFSPEVKKHIQRHPTIGYFGISAICEAFHANVLEEDMDLIYEDHKAQRRVDLQGLNPDTTDLAKDIVPPEVNDTLNLHMNEPRLIPLRLAVLNLPVRSFLVEDALRYRTRELYERALAEAVPPATAVPPVPEATRIVHYVRSRDWIEDVVLFEDCMDYLYVRTDGNPRPL